MLRKGSAFKVGDCTAGAIVTVTPADAVMGNDVFYGPKAASRSSLTAAGIALR